MKASSVGTSQKEVGSQTISLVTRSFQLVPCPQVSSLGHTPSLFVWGRNSQFAPRDTAGRPRCLESARSLDPGNNPRCDSTISLSCLQVTINHSQQLQVLNELFDSRTSIRRGHTLGFRRRLPFRGDSAAVLCWGSSSQQLCGSVSVSVSTSLSLHVSLKCHQEAFLGLWKSYFLFLPLGDCTNFKKRSPSCHTAPCRVSRQNAKFHHSAQADTVFKWGNRAQCLSAPFLPLL